MAISVSYYGNKKPAEGVKPQRTIELPRNIPTDKLPFGKANPVDWMTGKHMVQFGEGEGEGVEVVVDVRYDTTAKQLQKKVIHVSGLSGKVSDWKMLDGGQAVPERNT